jgi:hypothetical protein
MSFFGPFIENWFLRIFACSFFIQERSGVSWIKAVGLNTPINRAWSSLTRRILWFIIILPTFWKERKSFAGTEYIPTLQNRKKRWSTGRSTAWFSLRIRRVQIVFTTCSFALKNVFTKLLAHIWKYLAKKLIDKGIFHIVVDLGRFFPYPEPTFQIIYFVKHWLLKTIFMFFNLFSNSVCTYVTVGRSTGRDR